MNRPDAIFNYTMRYLPVKSAIVDLSLSALLALLVLATAPGVLAGDIVNDVGSDESPIVENGGYLELGIISIAEKHARLQRRLDANDPLSFGLELTLSASIRYKRFFAEASRSGFDGLNLGFTLWQNPAWSVDFLAANIAGSINDVENLPPPVTEQDRDNALLERDTLFIAAGTRVTRYFGNTIAQFRLIADWYQNNGILASARLGHQWQRGNWNLQGFVGARYNSRRMNQYWFGITAEEATERFTEYDAESAVLFEAELGATYPINRDWVYGTRLRYRRYPNAITDSPLVDGNKDVIFSNSLSYVF